MKFGFVTNYNEAVMQMASRLGFDCVEVFADANTPMDVTLLKESDFDRLREARLSYGVGFGAVASAVNHMTGDANQRAKNNEYFLELIKNCKKLGSEIVMTNVWADPELSPVANLTRYKEVFSEYALAAEAEGVRIVVENCPHSGGYPMKIGNICYSPEMWGEMFEAVPSRAIGLEYDPSHLYWQRIDYVKAIRDFGGRIYACHAKDTEVDNEVLGRVGIMGPQARGSKGWWRYRMPGMGEIDFKAVFGALKESGFNGPMFIEHEDPEYEGARYEEGLRLGLEYLKRINI